MRWSKDDGIKKFKKQTNVMFHFLNLKFFPNCKRMQLIARPKLSRNSEPRVLVLRKDRKRVDNEMFFGPQILRQI